MSVAQIHLWAGFSNDGWCTYETHSLPWRRDPTKSRLLLPELSNSCSKPGQTETGKLVGLERMCTRELVLQLPDI